MSHNLYSDLRYCRPSIIVNHLFLMADNLAAILMRRTIRICKGYSMKTLCWLLTVSLFSLVARMGQAAPLSSHMRSVTATPEAINMPQPALKLWLKKHNVVMVDSSGQILFA